jgi:hypothetical protein
MHETVFYCYSFFASALASCFDIFLFHNYVRYSYIKVLPNVCFSYGQVFIFRCIRCNCRPKKRNPRLFFDQELKSAGEFSPSQFAVSCSNVEMCLMLQRHYLAMAVSGSRSAVWRELKLLASWDAAENENSTAKTSIRHGAGEDI